MTPAGSSLLKQLAEGGESAMDAVLEQYGRLIWWMARRWSRNAADAEDAVQEILLDLWKSAARYDPTLGREEVFISVIARRRLLDRHRQSKMRRETMLEERLPSAGEMSAESSYERMEESSAAMHLLDQLDADQDKMLRLAFGNGFTNKRIAQQLGIPQAAVARTMTRGLQRLEQLILQEQANQSE